MVDKNKIIYEAQMYLNGDLSISKLADSLGISKKTLQNHFKQLELIDKELYDQVQKKKEQNITAGQVLGGQTGKATSSHTKEEIENIAKNMINLGLTYREAEDYFKIPKSTIYELLHSGALSDELTEGIDSLADNNNQNAIGNNFSKK